MGFLLISQEKIQKSKGYPNNGVFRLSLCPHVYALTAIYAAPPI
jgi:hypothetical protein